MGNSDGGLWLAIAPTLAGWRPGEDLGPYLARGAELYAGKPWAEGRHPEAVRAHPQDAANGAGMAAQGLGLVIIPDPRVAKGTLWLGMKGGASGETT